MSELKDYYPQIRLTLLTVYVILFVFISFEFSNLSSTTMYTIVVFLIYTLSFIGVPVLVYKEAAQTLNLIDTYILGIPYNKINNQVFYCQVCKEIVEADDEYCSHCGMML